MNFFFLFLHGIYKFIVSLQQTFKNITIMSEKKINQSELNEEQLAKVNGGKVKKFDLSRVVVDFEGEEPAPIEWNFV